MPVAECEYLPLHSSDNMGFAQEQHAVAACLAAARASMASIGIQALYVLRLELLVGPLVSSRARSWMRLQQQRSVSNAKMQALQRCLLLHELTGMSLCLLDQTAAHELASSGLLQQHKLT